MTKKGKSSISKWLGKSVRKLIMAGEEMNMNFFRNNLITYKMVIKLNVFCMCMKCKVVREVSYTNIVTLEDWSVSKERPNSNMRCCSEVSSVVVFARALYPALVLN